MTFLEFYIHYTLMVESAPIPNMDLDKAYDVFRNEYIKSTGYSWPKETFISKAKHWTFYGNDTGWIAAKKNNNDYMKLVAMAGNMMRKTKTLRALVQTNVPLYGVCTANVVPFLSGAGMMPPPNKYALDAALQLNILGDATFIDYSDDGGIILNFPGIGKLTKYVMGTPAFWQKLLQ